MKELKETVDLMLSDNWQDRLKAEIYQTQIRQDKLNGVLEKMNKDDPAYEMLYSQSVHMTDYLCDLQTRASAFGIELESLDITEEDKNNDALFNCCCQAVPPSNFDYCAFLLGTFFGSAMNGGDKK